MTVLRCMLVLKIMYSQFFDPRTSLFHGLNTYYYFEKKKTAPDRGDNAFFCD